MAAMSPAMRPQRSLADWVRDRRMFNRRRQSAVRPRAKRRQEANQRQANDRKQLFHSGQIISYHDHVIARTIQIFQKLKYFISHVKPLFWILYYAATFEAGQVTAVA